MSTVVTATAVSYESFAPRSTAQVSRLSRIAALTPGPTARATSAAAAATSNSASNNNERGLLCQAMSVVSSSSASSATTNVEEKCNENEQESSSSSLSLRTVSVALEQAQQLADVLTHELKHTTSLRLACRACLNIAEDVSSSHASLIRHSGELSAAADRLQDEAQLLQHHADDIGHPLQHYDAVDRIGILVGVLFKHSSHSNKMTTVRGLAKTKVDNDDFPALLDEIDDAVDYFEKKSGGKEALMAYEKQQQQQHQQGGGQQQQGMSGNLEYYRRALVLQEAALDLIKQAVADRITSTTQQIAAQLLSTSKSSSSANNSNHNNNNPAATATPVADQLEASLIYTRFHGISNRSHRLLSLVRARCHKSVAYVDLLHTCRTTYCTCRESLLRQPLREYMEKLHAQHGAVGMARLASVFLIRLLTVETLLFLDFFGTKESSSPSKITTTISSDPTSSDNDTTDSAAHNNSSGAAGTAATVTDKTFQDVEFQTYLATLCTSLHRTVRRSLVTCLDLDILCQMVSVLRQEGQVAARQAMTLAAARSMAQVMEDAQERVIFCANTTLRQQVLRFKASPADLDYPKKLQIMKQNKATTPTPTTTTSAATSTADGEDDVNRAEQQLEQVYESWFPPMRTVLRILSKIFRVVEPVVFEDLALQSIQACTKSLKDGAVYILKRQGVLHADLFLVKHLLILREQLSPFDMELRTVERQLDFSDAGKAVVRFLANRNRRIFSMSTENNALMTLLREGVSVQESSVDSKRDLEEALKSACNDFIEHTSTSLAGPVLNLFEECKTDKDKSKSSKTRNADYIQNMLVNKTLNDLPSKMDNLLECMGLYLDNPATQSILLKPAIRKVTRATEGVRRWIQTQCANDDDESGGGGGGWNAEKRTAILDALNRVDDLVKKVNKPGVAAGAATPAVAAATSAVATSATPEASSSS